MFVHGTSSSRSAGASLDVLENVLLADASAGSGALDVVEVDPVLVGEPAHERRDDAPLRRVAGGLRLLTVTRRPLTGGLGLGCRLFSVATVTTLGGLVAGVCFVGTLGRRLRLRLVLALLL